MCLLLPFFVVVKLTAETEMNWVKKKTKTTDSDFAICVKHGSEFWWCDKSRQMILDIDNAHCCTYSFPVYSKWVKRFEKGVKSNIIDMFCYFLEHKD